MVCWGPSRWGVRRLLSHVNHLPRDSAYVRELQGERAYWDESVELLAQTVDAIRLNSYYYLGAHGARPDEPKWVKRPHAAPAVSAPPAASGGLAEFNALIGE